MKISTIEDFRAALKGGPFAWPGGYPLFFLCNDGAALSCEYAKENANLIEGSITEKDNTGGWLVIACEVNWEDSMLYCEGGKRIESAYAG